MHKPEVLTRLVDALGDEGADVIAVTGDLVQLGLPEEIAEAGDWLAALASLARVVVVPGNHDIYHADATQLVRHTWAPYMFADAESHFPVIQRFDGVTLIGLCSARPEPFWSAGGELGEDQLSALDAALSEAAGEFRCVLIHHPPLSGHCANRKALRDVEELQRVLQRHQVELCLHGHNHRNRQSALGQHGQVLATASASNSSEHAPASYRVLEIVRAGSAWQVEATLKTLSPKTTNFELAEQVEWRLPTVEER